MPLKKIIFLIPAAVLGALSLSAETPATSLLVLDKDDARLSIVDPASGQVIARVATGESPHEVVTSPDGKFAFVTNYGARTPGSTISMIDLAAQKEVRRIDLGALRKPHGIDYSDGKVYFTAEINKLIGRIDPSSGQIDFLLGTGQNSTHMVMVTPDKQYIVTANIAGNSVSVFEKTPGPQSWNQTVVPVGKGPEGLDFSPDGKQLWTAHSQDGGVSVIDIASKKVVSTFSVGTKRSNRIKFTPDGKYVLISDLAGNALLVIDPATKKEVKRFAIGKSPEGILMEPGGARAYIAITGENRIDVLDLKALEVTGHLVTGAGPDGMAWAIRRP